MRWCRPAKDLSSPVPWQQAEVIFLPSSAISHLYLICPHVQMAQVPFQTYLDGDKLLLGGVLIGRVNFLPVQMAETHHL